MSAGVIAAIAYGVLAIAGGAVGYAKVRSTPSLVSGLVSGIVLIIGAIAQLQGFAWGLWLAAIVTGLLLVVFAVRLGKTRKFMPAGIMLIAGVAAIAVMLTELVG